MNMVVVDSPYSCALTTEVRDVKTPADVLKKRLLELGRIFGEQIVGDQFLTPTEVITPLGETFKGMKLSRTRFVVVSTRDDYDYFAKGIGLVLPNEPLRGYMDFNGARGLEALKGARRAIQLPDINKGEVVDTIIVAKAVLATGCTAISLTKTAISKYMPRKVIIASVFYTEQGIFDLYSELPNLHTIYAHGQPDSLNNAGMLIPGIGNLDQRLSVE